MDIHKPKPWHGWREFLKEYAIIVLGVLTALGGEQTVEWLHWRHEVAETENALRTELARNASAQLWRIEQSQCVKARLADLQTWPDAAQSGHPRKPKAPIAQPLWITYFRDSWDVAQTGQVAAHIPLERRIKYAQLYATAENQNVQQAREAELWHALYEYEGADDLDRQELRRLRGLILGISRADDNYLRNLPTAKARWTALGVTPEGRDPNSRARPDTLASLCKPMFGDG